MAMSAILKIAITRHTEKLMHSTDIRLFLRCTLSYWVISPR